MKIVATENGPVVVPTGGSYVVDGEEKTGSRVALCRCGASDRKPFCSGAHAKVGFTAPAAEIELEG